MCKIDAAALRDTSNVALQTLAEDMRAEIFGQDRAVNEVVEAVQMAKAGLGDDDKPMASLLFAGTFTIYYLNLENKLIYKVIYPFLQKHYNSQQRDRRI